MKNTEILIPTWPQSTGCDRIGAQDFGNSGFDHDGFWVPLRARPIGDGYDGAYEYRVWQDISMYVWVSARYSMHIEFKAHDVHSADERELMMLCKRIKWINSRIKDLGDVTVDNLPYRLMYICKQLGIKRTIKYVPYVHTDDFGDVEEAIAAIVSEVKRRLDRMPRKDAA